MNKWGVRLIALRLIILAVSIFITACETRETQLAPMSTVAPTIAITPTSTKSPLEIISAPNYMQECRDKYGKTTITQANYKDMIPGVTTSDEVLLRFGAPLKIYEGMSFYAASSAAVTWEYDEYYFSLRNEVVESILTRGAESTLDELVNQYGCPEIINHYYIPNEFSSAGSFYYSEPVNITIFAYPSIGLDYTFQGFPLSISQVPESILFFKASTIKKYLSWGDNLIGEFIDWQEAVP